MLRHDKPVRSPAAGLHVSGASESRRSRLRLAEGADEFGFLPRKG